MAEVILLEGYVTPSRGAKSRSKKQMGGHMASAKQKAHQAKFGRASKACKGMGKNARKACIRKKMKK